MSETPHLDKVLKLAASMPHGPDGKFITPGGGGGRGGKSKTQSRESSDFGGDTDPQLLAEHGLGPKLNTGPAVAQKGAMPAGKEIKFDSAAFQARKEAAAPAKAAAAKAQGEAMDKRLGTKGLGEPKLMKGAKGGGKPIKATTQVKGAPSIGIQQGAHVQAKDRGHWKQGYVKGIHDVGGKHEVTMRDYRTGRLTRIPARLLEGSGGPAYIEGVS